MIIATAFNRLFAPCGDLCVESLKKYTALFPRHEFMAEIIPDDYPRPPSWYKVGMIRRLLRFGEQVVWIDADALIVGTADIAPMLSLSTLNIARDANGPNCGVMAWTPTKASEEALDRIDAGYERHKDDKWFEQSSLMEFIGELDVFYQPKHIWNAYLEDRCPETLILHFPGMAGDRLAAMKEASK